ncbi:MULTISPECIES: 4Fe-4S cluster-binding domain-containing protein [unclassified Thermosipho (in: thermotogales)]|uniref:4Fe-4S cluster-binding domain-containing protein n=2 Tax=Thermosipho TaxID=2420 RepID=UPI001E471CE3|nr:MULTISPECIES: 4Fe-4S cluster-binding domain-containing protein [unclassified Thermosipho (in: thermotogales)]
MNTKKENSIMYEGEKMKVYVNRVFFNTIDHPKYFALSIYFQGCDKQPKCPLCHNKDTWEPFKGFEYDVEALIKRLKEKINTIIDSYDKLAVVYLGGEPLAPYNRKAVFEISKALKEEFSDKIVNTIYTWRTLEDIDTQNLRNYITYMDEGILGPYEHDKRNIDENGNLLFPASKNQKYVKFSRRRKTCMKTY